MELTRFAGGMEDGVGIPEDLRCKRSDGKQWRCSALSMPDKTVCEKHYIQAKKRAANSALRASLKKAKRKSSGTAADDAGGDMYLDGGCQNDDQEMHEMSMSPMNVGGGEYSGPSPVKRYSERMYKGQGLYSPEKMGVKGGSSARLRHGEEAQRDLMQENHVRSAYSTPPMRKVMKGSGPGDYSGRSTDSSGDAEGLTCHQCRRNDRARVVWCMSCDKRGYCDTCVSRRYPDISMVDIRRVCPACRGICNCRLCIHGDHLIKARLREMPIIDKLKHLHRLLSFSLPILKQIHSEQCFELDVEIRVYGIKTDIPRAKIDADEQMCCDFCRIPIFDYHRHCTNCMYDLCLTCCRDLRRASPIGVKGESAECQDVDTSQDIGVATMHMESSQKRNGDHLTHSTDHCTIDFPCLYPKWKANSDNSIPCPPMEAGGCGSTSLVLRRILKLNWVAKLVKNSEEMVNGCKTLDSDSLLKCTSCTWSTMSQPNQSSDSKHYQCSHREDGSDNFLYNPASQDIKQESIGHFHKHWVKGEPVIVKHAFESSLSSCWDPMSIWRGIQETVGDKEDDVVVKAINLLNQSEVDIELSQFIEGYTKGHINEDGQPEMLKLKAWPPTNALEEFLLCQRPEFLSKLPLLVYIHSKWGLLNLAAKLPHDTMQTDVGPKIFIAYGTHEELGRGVSMTNLQINMGDLVYLLMHTSEVKFQGQKQNKVGNIQKTDDESDTEESHGNAHVVESDTNLKEAVDSSVLAGNEHGMQDQVYGSLLNEKEDEIMEDEICNGIEIAPGGKKEVEPYNPDGSLVGVPENSHAGVVWDVFRRQDVPKLNEYLIAHWKELKNPISSPSFDLVDHAVYDQGLFLNMDHKRKLKEEFGIEPWTFQQHVGEAVFIPAGCPFQVRNFQSTVQLGLDFLSPESLEESVHLAQEIRCLPNDHEAKLQMLEVGKMCLYAASSAIREIRKITLDPKLVSEIKFEDRNLTAMVSENLERMTKRRQTACV